jgi:hypothetical protein
MKKRHFFYCFLVNWTLFILILSVKYLNNETESLLFSAFLLETGTLAFLFGFAYYIFTFIGGEVLALTKRINGNYLQAYLISMILITFLFYLSQWSTINHRHVIDSNSYKTYFHRLYNYYPKPMIFLMIYFPNVLVFVFFFARKKLDELDDDIEKFGKQKDY